MRDNCSCDLYNRSLCDLPAVCWAWKCGKISLDTKKKNMCMQKKAWSCQNSLLFGRSSEWNTRKSSFQQVAEVELEYLLNWDLQQDQPVDPTDVSAAPELVQLHQSWCSWKDPNRAMVEKRSEERMESIWQIISKYQGQSSRRSHVVYLCM